MFALLILIQQSHMRLNALSSQQEEKLQVLIPEPYAMKLMSLGFDQLIADCYWLAFVSYVGDVKERAKDKYVQADRYLDLITGLDPFFLNAYWFAAFTVGAEQRRPKRAAEIIERGIHYNQNNWYLPFMAGINQYLYANNEIGAAKYFRMASKYPDSPSWLLRQSEILEARIPSRIKEINIWSNVYSSDADSRVREMARQKLIDLWGQVVATHPPPNIREKAVASLRDLGVDIDFYLEHIRSQNKP